MKIKNMMIAKSDLEEVYAATLKFMTPQALEETYETIVTEAMKLVGAKYGSLFIPKHGAMKRMYASDPILYTVKVNKKGNTRKSYESGEPYVLKPEELIDLHPEYKELGIGSDLSVPLTYNSQVRGVLSVIAPEGIKYGKKEIDILKAFGQMATLAIKKVALYDRVKSALESRNLFMSIAAHELRTPLTTMFAYAQLIDRSLNKGKNPPKLWSKRLLHEMKRLTKLINDFLQIDQYETGKLAFKFQKASINNILLEAIDNFYYSNFDYKLEYENKVDLSKDYIYGDSDRLTQVFVNLLNNAARFSVSGSKIEVSLNEKDRDLIVKVRDYGKGIIKADLPKIFDKFYKGKNSKPDGLGIGLYLAKTIIDRHKGTISVNSKIHKGTTITVTLPRNTP
jgi:signal transduction histidine kinase